MNETSRRILIFSLVFALFFTVFPVLLGTTLPFFPLVQKADLVELFSVFFIIPAYWYLFEAAGQGAPHRREVVAFILLTTLFALADGLHLAGNSIQHLMPETGESPSFRLAYFFHKPFSHYALGLALVGLSTSLIGREGRFPPGAGRALWPEAVSACLYGFSFVCFAISGKVTSLALIYSPAVVSLSFARRKSLRSRPILAFFGLAYLLSLLLCMGWGIYWRGFPNFDEVGLPS